MREEGLKLRSNAAASLLGKERRDLESVSATDAFPLIAIQSLFFFVAFVSLVLIKATAGHSLI